MTLRLNGSTSGYTEIDAPATAGNNSLLLPASNGSANQFLKNGSTAGTLGWSSLVEDSSGRLLIGTDSATNNVRLEQNTGFVTTGNNIFGGINITSYCGTLAAAAPILDLQRSRGTTDGTLTKVENGDRLGSLIFRGADGSKFLDGAIIAAFADGTTGSDDMPSRLVLSTTKDGQASPTEAMRIDSQQRVGIGRAPTYELDVYRASGSVVILCDSDSLANNESAALYANGGARNAGIGVNKHSGITNPCGFINLAAEDNAANWLWVDNSDVLRISTTQTHIGTISGTVVGAQTSDERLKNILGPVEYGLETLKQIEPVRYTLKTEPDTEKLGFIAQQVLPLVPQSVFDTGEEIEEGEPTKLGMEYVALIPVLVNAIKELSAEVDALKAQLS